MLGNDNPTNTVTDGLPEGWYACHYPGRRQPYTLQQRLHYKNDRHHLPYETVRFCATLNEAAAIAKRGELRGAGQRDVAASKEAE